MLIKKAFIISLICSCTFVFSQESIDIALLQKPKLNVYLVKKTGEPYTGKAYGLYANGQLGMSGEIVNGKFDGLWTWWYEDGSVKRETSYQNGLKTGCSYWWYKNGVKKSEIQFVSNKNVAQKRWDETGKRLPNPKLGSR